MKTDEQIEQKKVITTYNQLASYNLTSYNSDRSIHVSFL